MEINVYKHKYGVLKFVEVSSSYDVDIRENGNYDFFKQMNMESHKETQAKVKILSSSTTFNTVVSYSSNDLASIQSAYLTRYAGKKVTITINLLEDQAKWI